MTINIFKGTFKTTKQKIGERYTKTGFSGFQIQ